MGFIGVVDSAIFVIVNMWRLQFISNGITFPLWSIFGFGVSIYKNINLFITCCRWVTKVPLFDLKHLIWSRTLLLSQQWLVSCAFLESTILNYDLLALYWFPLLFHQQNVWFTVSVCMSFLVTLNFKSLKTLRHWYFEGITTSCSILDTTQSFKLHFDTVHSFCGKYFLYSYSTGVQCYCRTNFVK